MAALAGLIRTLIFWLVTVAVLLMVGRYLVDVFPRSDIIAPAAEWVRKATQPAISSAEGLFGVSARFGFWNPLPLGIAVGAMIAGGIVNALLDLLFTPLPRPGHKREEKPQARGAIPSVLPPAEPPQPEEPEPAAEPTPDPTGATMFTPAAASSAKGARPAAGQPTKIGRYEIAEVLGRGAMGMVYKAKDPQLDRTVAIKTVLTSAGSDTTAEEFKKRFFAEARAAGKLNHPGIMKVYDLIENEHGQPCMVLEYFAGPTLDKLVEERVAFHWQTA